LGGAATILSDAVFAREAGRLARLAAEQRLPVIYGFRGHVLASGLMAYGPSFADLFRRAAGYVDKILRGAKPGDLGRRPSKGRRERSNVSVRVAVVTLAIMVSLAGQGCAAVGLALFGVGAGVAGGTGVSYTLDSIAYKTFTASEE